MKKFRFTKHRCFFTEEVIFRYYNISSKEEVDEANDDFAWSKEHLISKNHHLFNDLSEDEKAKNIVDTARVINSNLNDSPLYIKLIMKDIFTASYDKYHNLSDTKKDFSKKIKEVCAKYNFNRGISYRQNEAYHTEIDKIIFNYYFKKEKYTADLSKIPSDILKKLKKEKFFKKTGILKNKKRFEFSLGKFKFSIIMEY